MQPRQQQLEPYARIARAGFDIRFKQATGNVWAVYLMREGVAVACKACPRNSHYSLAEAEARSRAAEWSAGSPVNEVLAQLADIAESTMLDPTAYAAMCECVRAVTEAGKGLSATK
jgi:hypothetical protein